MKAVRKLSLKTIRLDQDGRVLTATIVNPPLNMANPEFLRELEVLTKTINRDPSVGAVILTGGIEGRFLTHADPSDIAAMAEAPHPPMRMGFVEQGLRMMNVAMRLPGLPGIFERLGGPTGRGFVWGARWKRTVLRMNRSGTVYLAAINGAALGGGQEIALACDLRYASDSERVRMGQIEILAGQIPGGGGTQRLPAMLGSGRALEHMLEGAPIGAKEALELGLVHRVIAAEDLLAETKTTAARLALRQSTAIAAIKRSVYLGNRRKFGRGLDMELSGFVASQMTRASSKSLATLNAEIKRLGDSPFLADPAPWIAGTKIRQVP